jgi:hypothetical protein
MAAAVVVVVMVMGGADDDVGAGDTATVGFQVIFPQTITVILCRTATSGNPFVFHLAILRRDCSFGVGELPLAW